MDLKNILKSLENCPCGKKHTFATELVRIESGLTAKVGEILADFGFPKQVLVVSDDSAMGASAGVLESLAAAGFAVKKLIYPQMIYAKIEQVDWNTWLTDVYAGRQFEGTVVGFDASILSPTALLARWVSDSSKNMIGFKSAEYDAAYAAAQNTADDDRRHDPQDHRQISHFP